MKELEMHYATLGKETGESYRYLWTGFVLWTVNENIDFLQLSVENCYAFFAYHKRRLAPDGKPLAWATVVRYVNVLASCYGFLCRIGKVKENPWIHLREALPSLNGPQKTQRRMLSKEEVMSLIHAPEKNTPWGIRDRAMFAVFFGGGLRRSEVHKLNIEDFKVSPTGIIYLFLKETKTRTNDQQVVPDWVSEHLSVLISLRKAEGAAISDPLFISYFYQNSKPRARLSKKHINTVFKKYSEELGIEKVTSHCGRVTFVSRLKELGFDDRDVAKASRHQCLAMVKVYDKRRLTLSDNVALKINYESEDLS